MTFSTDNETLCVSPLKVPCQGPRYRHPPPALSKEPSSPSVNITPMPDWFDDAFPSDAELRWENILVRLISALVLGAVVATIYRTTRKRNAVAANDLTQTLLLLAVVIAMITLAIGGNVARAFSLVGALAIVRFRSVVDDPRDTAFVILAVAVGLAVGAGFIVVPLMGLPIAGIVAWGFASDRMPFPAPHGPGCRVSLRAEPECTPAALEALLAAHLDDCRPRRIETVKKGTLVELVYSGRLKPGSDGYSVVQALQAAPGVVGVDLLFPDAPVS